MRKLILSIFCIVFLYPVVVKAQWYVGAASEIPYKFNCNLEKSDNQVQFGYDFGMQRLEMEGFYQSDSIDAIDIHDTEIASFMVNGIYELDNSPDWDIFLGVGGGAAYLDYNNSLDNIQGDDWRLAYQGVAGISHDIDKDTSIKLQYRYFSTLGDNDINEYNEASAINNYDNHTVSLGISCKIGDYK